MSERRFPIQYGGSVDWAAAERAYITYAYHFGTSQSLDRLAERGGFHVGGFCVLYRELNPLRVSSERVAEIVLSMARELGDRWQP